MPRLVSKNPFENVDGFEWDKGNKEKNQAKHGVSWREAEELFGNQPIIVAEDPDHSAVEQRYSARGKTNKDRKLTIIFTIRGKKIRVVSARDQGRGERRFYEQVEKAQGNT